MEFKNDLMSLETVAVLKRLRDLDIPICVFLHPPKSGGTSVSKSLFDSPHANGAWLNALKRDESGVCSCGDLNCEGPRGGSFDPFEMEAAAELGERRQTRLFVGHKNYSFIKMVTDALGTTDKRGSVFATARPARQRLVSVFRDYWTQVESFRGNAPVNRNLNSDACPKTENAVGLGYLNDSKHYEDEKGNIDGVGWFSAFQVHGPGVPFFWDDFFEGDFPLFRRLIRSKRLRVIDIKHLDAFVEEVTGSLQPRSRMSLPINPAVQKALEDASDAIDSLALRDAKFDAFLARQLKNPDFKTG
jgi:hypothetical protein